jgi:hypothetical protein
VLVTIPAEAVNVADVVPEETITEDGTVSRLLSLASDTITPAGGAACEIVTVHCTEESFFSDFPLQFREPKTVCVASETVAVTEVLL